MEAEIAKNRLEELKKQCGVLSILICVSYTVVFSEESRRKEALKSRQIAERLGVEEVHLMEFQQFTALYGLSDRFGFLYSLCPGGTAKLLTLKSMRKNWRMP